MFWKRMAAQIFPFPLPWVTPKENGVQADHAIRRLPVLAHRASTSSELFAATAGRNPAIGAAD
jgi:hypothetical protein